MRVRRQAVEDVVALAAGLEHTRAGEDPQVLRAPTAPPPPPAPAPRTLQASVGPAGKATLSARSVKTGAYRIVVRDRSARHSFRLAGRRVSRTTGADFTGRVTWRVRLARGVYRFGSDARRLPGRLRVR
ncbi:MAG TPA: hypothetical protein VKA24_02800 [Gaiellaceae bacterium]|nr:hypothetical protein [Gaiellaceae bacterium]